MTVDLQQSGVTLWKEILEWLKKIDSKFVVIRFWQWIGAGTAEFGPDIGTTGQWWAAVIQETTPFIIVIIIILLQHHNTGFWWGKFFWATPILLTTPPPPP